MSGHSSATS